MNTEQPNLIKSKFINYILAITPYVFFFFIFSFMGWVVETIYCYITYGSLLERGFLYAPICPIYGFLSLILILFFDKSKQKRNYIKLFFLFILIFSFFEYLTGFTLEAIFGLRWWDYSDSKYNLNGRITLVNSFFWGVITVLFAKFIYPLVNLIREKVIKKIPNIVQIILVTLLLIGLEIDFILSCIKYLQ